jgi:hypothetical protein
MLLRLKIVGGVHSVVLPVPGGGYDNHGGGACYAAAAPCCWRRSRRRPAAAGSVVVARRPRRGSATVVVMALKEEPDGSRSGFAGGGGPSWDPGLEIQVPFEQRPVTADDWFVVHIVAVDRVAGYSMHVSVFFGAGERVLCSQG